VKYYRRDVGKWEPHGNWYTAKASQNERLSGFLAAPLPKLEKGKTPRMEKRGKENLAALLTSFGLPRGGGGSSIVYLTFFPAEVWVGDRDVEHGKKQEHLYYRQYQHRGKQVLLDHGVGEV
jgi:hypothetical protein